MSPYGFAVKTKWFKAYDADEWLEFYFAGLDYILSLNRSGYAFTEFYAATILAKMLTPFEPGLLIYGAPQALASARSSIITTEKYTPLTRAVCSRRWATRLLE